MIKAIVGLGNSGSEYEKTYHNVGAFVAEHIFRFSEQEGTMGGLRLYPISGFMNESGVPVRAWMKQNNLNIDEILVVHDDSDLEIGAYKLVRGGGSAGHKGILSLVTHLGTEEFWRLRIGVRDPNEEVRKKAGEFVLRQWSGSDELTIINLCAKIWPELNKLII